MKKRWSIDLVFDDSFKGVLPEIDWDSQFEKRTNKKKSCSNVFFKLAKKYDGQCWTAETDCVDKKRIRAFWFDRKEDINSFCSDVKKKFGNKVVFAEIHDLNDDD